VTHKFQFSLRTLLLATLFVGVILALSVPLFRWLAIFSSPVAPTEELEQIVAKAIPVVEAIERFRKATGRYPANLEEAGVAAPWTRHGILIYEADRPNDDTYPGYDLHLYLGQYDTYLLCRDGQAWCVARRGHVGYESLAFDVSALRKKDPARMPGR
jgi:hypothetical protein